MVAITDSRKMSFRVLFITVWYIFVAKIRKKLEK